MGHRCHRLSGEGEEHSQPCRYEEMPLSGKSTRAKNRYNRRVGFVEKYKDARLEKNICGDRFRGANQKKHAKDCNHFSLTRLDGLQEHLCEMGIINTYVG